MKQNWIVVGALSGAIAVGLGAFGAHGLAERLDTRQLEVWRTAVHYQMFHAVALLALPPWGGMDAVQLAAYSAYVAIVASKGVGLLGIARLHAQGGGRAKVAAVQQL